MLIKILVTLFVLFAVSRVFLRYREKRIGLLTTLVWCAVWMGIVTFVWWPRVSDIIANSIGVGRGVDALLFVAVIILFYGAFRLYIKIDFIERQLTDLVRKIALREASDGQKDGSGKKSD